MLGGRSALWEVQVLLKAGSSAGLSFVSGRENGGLGVGQPSPPQLVHGGSLKATSKC